MNLPSQDAGKSLLLGRHPYGPEEPRRTFNTFRLPDPDRNDRETRATAGIKHPWPFLIAPIRVRAGAAPVCSSLRICCLPVPPCAPAGCPAHGPADRAAHFLPAGLPDERPASLGNRRGPVCGSYRNSDSYEEQFVRDRHITRLTGRSPLGVIPFPGSIQTLTHPTITARISWTAAATLGQSRADDSPCEASSAKSARGSHLFRTASSRSIRNGTPGDRVERACCGPEVRMVRAAAERDDCGDRTRAQRHASVGSPCNGLAGSRSKCLDLQDVRSTNHHLPTPRPGRQPGMGPPVRGHWRTPQISARDPGGP